MSADIAVTESPWRAGRLRRLFVGSAGWARWSGSSAWQPTAAYGIPVALAAVAVQSWFRARGELASGDLAPPIVPGADYLAHWNDTTDGAGAPSFTIVTLPYSEGLRLFQALGLGETAFQRVWLTLVVAGAAAAVVFLTRSLFAPPLAAIVAGVVSTFNAYRLVIGFDWVPIAATAAAALLGALILRRGRASESPSPVVFALASLLLGPVFVNPPHLVLVLAWVLICVLLAWAVYGAPALARIGRFLAKAAPLALVFNLWWIVPAYLTVTGSVFAQQFTAGGVADWEWTHQRASVWNVLSLTSSWAWLQPAYYPISQGLEALPFNVLKFAPALVAVLGIILARGSGRRLAYVLAGTGIVAVLVIKGLHPPLGHVNLLLYQHLPGFWLFRDPSKAALVLVLVYSLLAALVVVELQQRSVALGAAAAAAIIAAAVVYAHPLLTGGLIAGKRPLLPPAHVHVPSGWRRAAAYVDALPETGKAIVLPELDYYQAPTTWGYYGASFFHQLFRRPLIEPLPGGYYSDPAVSRLAAELQGELPDRRADVRPVLRALGIRYVLLRRDLDTRFPGRSFVAPSKLAPALAHRPELRRLRSFGVVDVYETTGAAAPEVYPAVPLLVRGTSGPSLYGSFEVGTNAALVAPRDASSLAGISPGEATLVPIRPAPGVNGSSLRREGTAVSVGGGRVDLRFPRLSAPVRVTVGRRAFIVPAGPPRARSVPFAVSNAPTVYRFLQSDRIRPLPLEPKLARRVGDCNAYNDLTAKEARLSAVVYRRAGVATLRLGALAHAACVAMRIRGVTATAPFRLHLAYRRVSGNPPRLCIWEVGPNHCAAAPSLVSSRGWSRLQATATLDPGTTSTWLFLYADGGASQPTATEYRDLRVELPQAAIVAGVSPISRLPHIEYTRSAPYEFRVRVRGARQPFLLVLGETFAPGWRLDGGGQGSLRATHLPVNGYANGWRVSRLGSYDLKITYAPERLALWAREGDAILIPATLLFSLLGWAAQRRRLRVVAFPARPLPTTLAVRPGTAATEPTGPQVRVERPPEEADVARRVEQTRADLASEIESLRRRMTETRETMRSLFAEPPETPTHGGDEPQPPAKTE